MTHFLKESFDEIIVPPECSTNPIHLFDLWFKDAKNVSDNKLVGSAGLSTISKHGGPASRTIMVKSYDEHGFLFTTSAHSEKAIEIEKDARVSLLFVWYFIPAGETKSSGTRQVRIEGIAKKDSNEASQKNFEKESLNLKLFRIASNQKCSKEILQKIQAMKLQLQQNPEIEHQYRKPDSYASYLIQPNSIEFYQETLKTISVTIKYKLSSEPGEWIKC